MHLLDSYRAAKEQLIEISYIDDPATNQDKDDLIEILDRLWNEMDSETKVEADQYRLIQI